MRQRIDTIDGLRFLAALGVLWIHTWAAFGHPRYFIENIDLTNFFAIGENGVELFFVISGFCMYYFYAAKSEFSYHDFYRFLFKRWVRLSPAFYVITILYILVATFIYHDQMNGLFHLTHSIFYLNYIFGQYNTAPHFWTLSVEWQFYFTIPFLLIYQHRIGFKKPFLFIYGVIFLIAFIFTFCQTDRFDFLTKTIIYRGVEFGCGVIVARILLKGPVFIKKRALWLLMSIVVIYAGRILLSKQILSLISDHYNLSKLFGYTLMGIGFAVVLYLSITSTNWLNSILSSRLFKKMGRISYSFYLLHGLIFPVITNCTIAYLPFLKGVLAPVVTTFICVIILYPLSLLSYNLLEKPFLSIGNLTTK